MKKLLLSLSFMAAIVMVLSLVACGGTTQSGPKVDSLLSAGATFPQPLYEKMFSVYADPKVRGVRVDYGGGGSGNGVSQLKAKAVHFSGSDKFLSDEDIAEMGGVLHVPTCIGAIAVAYNLPGNPKLKLTGEVIADIFMGKITKWNDPKIASLNSGVSLPDMVITTVHRAKGSGTTYNFTYFLALTSSEWKEKYGADKVIDWPNGIAGVGNPGVANQIKEKQGAIGYIEIAFVKEAGLMAASVQNPKGEFIDATLEGASLCAGALPDDARVVIANADVSGAYPISTFTWLLLYADQETTADSLGRAEEVVRLLWWMIHEGQQYNEDLGYAKLPDAAVKKAEAILKKVKYEGQPVATGLNLK